jgi:hypothetical protein
LNGVVCVARFLAVRIVNNAAGIAATQSFFFVIIFLSVRVSVPFARSTSPLLCGVYAL